MGILMEGQIRGIFTVFQRRKFLLCLEMFQIHNPQFVKGPSIQGSGKPQERERGFLLKTGEGKDKQLPKEGGSKHCNEATLVKSMPNSILLPSAKTWERLETEQTCMASESLVEQNLTGIQYVSAQHGGLIKSLRSPLCSLKARILDRRGSGLPNEAR